MAARLKLREQNIIFGGEAKLDRALDELICTRSPKAVFVYATCVTSLIGDDIDAVCRKAEGFYKIPVIVVDCEGYKSCNHTRLAAPFEAIFKLIGTREPANHVEYSINLLGQYGSSGVVEGYFSQIGIERVISITGGATIEDIQSAHTASLNLVQRSRPMAHLARRMNEVYGVSSIPVSFFGVDATANAIRQTARFFEDPALIQDAGELIRSELAAVMPQIDAYRGRLNGVHAVVNSGGPYKTVALIEALTSVGVSVDAVSLRAVQAGERVEVEEVAPPNCALLDDATSQEIYKFARERGSSLVIGEVDDGLVCQKHGFPFCLHNQQTSTERSGFSGIVRFAADIEATINNPVWALANTHTAPWTLK